MYTTLAELTSDTVICPAGQDDGLSFDAALLERIIPLWIAMTDRGSRPSVRFRSRSLSAKTVGDCEGRWQLHVFSFATEARLAQQTLSLVAPDTVCEAGARPSGEGLLLVRQGDGPFECRIIDRRKTGPAEAPLGSWQVSQMLARRAVLYVPRRSADRATIAARMLAMEFDDPEESAALHAILTCGSPDRATGCLKSQDVVDAANRILEPVGLELSCSDRQVRAAIDAHLPELARQVEATVDRIAHQLVAELAQSGCVV